MSRFRFQGAYERAKHLLALGHRRVLFLDYERPDVSATQEDRFIGFKKEVDEADVRFLYDDRVTLAAAAAAEIEKRLDTMLAGCYSAVFVHDD